MKSFDALKKAVEAAEADADKFANKGNYSAGTRLRKLMQDVKTAANAVRQEVMDTRAERKSE